MVSKQISMLEDHLECRLLNRTTRHHGLTEAGHLYLEHCKSILDQNSGIEDVLGERSAEPRGTLRVNAPASYGRLFIAPLMGEFLNRYPSLRTELVLSDHYIDIIEEGFDLAVRIGGDTPPSLIARKIDQTRHGLYASPNWLAAHGHVWTFVERPSRPLGRPQATLAIDDDFPARRPFVTQFGQCRLVEELLGHGEQHPFFFLEVAIGQFQELIDHGFKGVGIGFLPGGPEKIVKPAVFFAHHGKRPHLPEVGFQAREQQVFLDLGMRKEKPFQHRDGAMNLLNVIGVRGRITHVPEQFVDNGVFTQQGIGELHKGILVVIGDGASGTGGKGITTRRIDNLDLG